jgi:hypothetical protein
MKRAILFAVLFASASLYALVRGGAPERVAAVGYLAAYIGSFLLVTSGASQFQSTEWALFLVDAILAALLVILALHANRYWTIWAASLQIVSLSAHVADFVVPEIAAPAYALTLIVWSYLALPILLVGTTRHQKRKTHYGDDPSWSNLANSTPNLR